MALKIKRIYEKPGETDGERFLVDRLWPRGISQEAARLTAWLKDLAPSTGLRQWFGHDPGRWPEFQERYRAELQNPAKTELLRKLADKATHGTVTLVYGARDEARNNAIVLQDLLEQYLKADKA
ncbi:MAG: hypothetical protein A2Y80_02885 [Deltaproteobacteria bacterium RBG_13_58_19]|nr:MAG: hypothetical protein A2Y80_02885 [Deltaproteobacteria bacterium RBG_13_58_19]